MQMARALPYSRLLDSTSFDDDEVPPPPPPPQSLPPPELWDGDDEDDDDDIDVPPPPPLPPPSDRRSQALSQRRSQSRPDLPPGDSHGGSRYPSRRSVAAAAKWSTDLAAMTRRRMEPLASPVDPKGILRVSMKKSSTPSDHMSLSGPR